MSCAHILACLCEVNVLWSSSGKIKEIKKREMRSIHADLFPPNGSALCCVLFVVKQKKKSGKSYVIGNRALFCVPYEISLVDIIEEMFKLRWEFHSAPQQWNRIKWFQRMREFSTSTQLFFHSLQFQQNAFFSKISKSVFNSITKRKKEKRE